MNKKLTILALALVAPAYASEAAPKNELVAAAVVKKDAVENKEQEKPERDTLLQQFEEELVSAQQTYEMYAKIDGSWNTTRIDDIGIFLQAASAAHGRAQKIIDALSIIDKQLSFQLGEKLKKASNGKLLADRAPMLELERKRRRNIFGY